MDQLARTRRLLGDAAMEKLAGARLAVFGMGGVGELWLIDGDSVSLTNLNRQLVATHDALGRPKAEVMAERVRAIDPSVKVVPRRMFYVPENADEMDLSRFDYIIDAVDTVAAKLEPAVRAQALGAGNKLDPTRFRVADIYETSVDPLARSCAGSCAGGAWIG